VSTLLLHAGCIHKQEHDKLVLRPRQGKTATYPIKARQCCVRLSFIPPAAHDGVTLGGARGHLWPYPSNLACCLSVISVPGRSVHGGPGPGAGAYLEHPSGVGAPDDSGGTMLESHSSPIVFARTEDLRCRTQGCLCDDECRSTLGSSRRPGAAAPRLAVRGLVIRGDRGDPLNYAESAPSSPRAREVRPRRARSRAESASAPLGACVYGFSCALWGWPSSSHVSVSP
jgi:hypothetical protein